MWVTLYTDASWYPDSKRGGWGYWAKSELGRLKNYGECPDWVDCNNSAEISAIIIGVIEIFDNWKEPISGILVCSDSTVAKSYLKYRPDGLDSLKREDWLEIREQLYNLLDANMCKIRIKHVKGHQSNKTTQGWLNNKVDEFSRKFE